MFYYLISNSVFNNPFLAFIHGSQHSPHEFPIFYANNAVYDRVNWMYEPEESWASLCRQRAEELRSKYEYLILGFSGGTDSITVYNTFRQNNIKIDEIVITYGRDNPVAPESSVAWLVQNHWDPSTRITHIDRQVDDVLQRHYHSDQWIMNNFGGVRRYEVTCPGPEVIDHCERSANGRSWCLITGHEKPHLVFEKGQWWVTHLDHVFHSVMGWPNVEMFFMGQDPRLHMKQCHMLKRWTKIQNISICEGWQSFAMLGKKNLMDYENFAMACGRDLDVVRGISFCQKVLNNEYNAKDTGMLINGDIHHLKIDKFLKTHMLNQRRSAVNYSNAWMTLQHDHTLKDYMLRHGLLHKSDQPMQKYNAILGKKYLLGN
jgi:hypothetical protein